MTAAGWLTMTLSLAMVWSATAWCFWMVLSRPRAHEAAQPATIPTGPEGRRAPAAGPAPS